MHERPRVCKTRLLHAEGCLTFAQLNAVDVAPLLLNIFLLHLLVVLLVFLLEVVLLDDTKPLGMHDEAPWSNACAPSLT